MRKFLLLLCLFVLCSCNKTNNQQKLGKIFDLDSFDFEITLQGCFAGSTDHFTLENQENGYLLTCKETHKSKQLSNEKVTQFKSLFASLVASKKEKEYNNTAYFKIEASNFFNKVAYDNSDEWTEFNDILKFTDIIPKL